MAARGRCGGHDVGSGENAGGVFKAHFHPVTHDHRPAEQKGPGRQGRVHEVLANAAEQLLHHDHGEEIADQNTPVRNRHRTNEGQQHTGDHGGQIVHRGIQVHELPVTPLEEHAARHADQRDHQRPEAEEIHAAAEGREQGDQHVPHDRPGGHGGMGVGRAGNGQLVEIFHWCHFPTSLTFSGGHGVADTLLAGPEGLHQRNGRRAGIGAAAALDAIQNS